MIIIGEVNMTRILVIDDEPQIRILVRKILEREGYLVTDAQNGKIGMELFQEEPFDLVITDIVMQEKEGIEVIGELLENFPDTKIIVISGGSLNLDGNNLLRSAKILGAHCTLSKPFEIEDLLNSVKQALESN